MPQRFYSMKMIPHLLRACRLAAAATVFVAALAAPSQNQAQTPARRLSVVPTASAARVPLVGSTTQRPATSTALGHLAGTVQLHGMALVLAPTAAQSAALAQLLADQQNPSSPSYRQWLTPAQFGARFGLADDDLAILQNWLTARGFTVDEVAPSRNRIVFSGTAAAVENAFSTTLQRYQRGSQTFFENSTELQIPATLADVISGISGISSYHLRPPVADHVIKPLSQLKPDYTTAGGNHYLVPWDVRQIYGSNTLIASGYDGTGIKIGVLGQSAVSTTQLTYFQQKTGQTVKLPTMVLVPNTGTSGTASGDEGESELDLEQASGGAPGATILFIYTGLGDNVNGTDGNNNGVFDALAYAITNNLAPILTLSYGACETESVTYINNTIEPVLKQASAQGQTFFAASGDEGATSCEPSSESAPTVATGGLSVSYPASSTYVTGVGGTTLSGTTSTYWSSTNNQYSGSATGYIPEVAWNDSVAYGSLSTSGGGFSAIFGKPSWQTGTGVPADGHRDVPDIALPAGVELNAYVTCSADADGGAASSAPVCTDTTIGFATGGGGAVGGTSAATPNVAAILAIIEQANGGGALGNINPSLYKLAAGSSASSIFHDITSGNNIVSCKAGTTGCSSTTVGGPNGTMGYTAGAGYDQVTGLGSIVAPALQAGLKSLSTTTSLLTPSVSLSLSNTSPGIGASVIFTATVSGSGATPTGAITFSVDGTTVGSAVTLASGTASYTYSGFTTSGQHTVIASYSGDGAYTSGTNTVSVTVNGASPGLTLSAAPTTLTITSGSSGNETLTVTSTNGYTGSVGFTATSSFPGCYALSSETISPAVNGSATTTMTLYTSSVACANANRHKFPASTLATSKPGSGPRDLGRAGWIVLSAGLLGCFALRRRRIGGLLAIAGLALMLNLSGCGSSSSSSTNSTVSTGTYTVQVVATSVGNSAISSSTSFTIVVQ